QTHCLLQSASEITRSTNQESSLSLCPPNTKLDEDSYEEQKNICEHRRDSARADYFGNRVCALRSSCRSDGWRHGDLEPGQRDLFGRHEQLLYRVEYRNCDCLECFRSGD